MKNWYNKIYYSLRRFWENISRWFSYYNVVRKIYDFDHSSILEVEKHQIKRVRDSIKYYHNHVNADRDIERMNLALKLLDIIQDGSCTEFHGKPLTFEPIEGTELSRIVHDGYYTISVYVNTKNANRFWTISKDIFDDSITGNLFKEQLRIEKAWYIYHKLRLYYLRTWWD